MRNETIRTDDFRKRNILGVVGGMGALASAEFVKTIYEHAAPEREQDAPVVMLHSDPTYPDRTEAFLAGEDDEVLAKLTDALAFLSGAGATRFVLCCMTIHHLLPRLPPGLRDGVVSLLDVIFARLAESEERHLLVCSTGTRRLGLFEEHPRWPGLKDRLVTPDETEQRRIHRDFIYPLKQNPDARAFKPYLESLLEKYGVRSFVAGCSEIHLVAKQLVFSAPGRDRYGCIDPLDIIARELAAECRAAREAETVFA